MTIEFEWRSNNWRPSGTDKMFILWCSCSENAYGNWDAWWPRGNLFARWHVPRIHSMHVTENHTRVLAEGSWGNRKKINKNQSQQVWFFFKNTNWLILFLIPIVILMTVLITIILFVRSLTKAINLAIKHW